MALSKNRCCKQTAQSFPPAVKGWLITVTSRATMTEPHKVYLAGGEGTGWALDADLAATRQALKAMPELVALTSLNEADVVHSVWEYPLLTSDRSKLDGKRIICHVCNNVLRTFEQACMVGARELIGRWVAISREAKTELDGLRLPAAYIPYSVDTGIFRQDLPPGILSADLRSKWGIPFDRYVISSFMRDSLGSDLSQPKTQKGADMLFQILLGLWRRKAPIHVLLAGPRRHWIRARLAEAGIPFTFAGQIVDGDDNTLNILAPATINELYHVSDLHLITSRWEGGPRAVIEAAATRTRVMSTPLAMARDILDPVFLFSSVDEGISRMEKEIQTPAANELLDTHYQRIVKDHTPSANVPRFRELYRGITDIPVYKHPQTAGPAGRQSPLISIGRRALQWVYRKAAKTRGCGAGLKFGLWHEFHKPPYGGGNQFMMALKEALRRQGSSVCTNRMSSSVDIHICNSAWFRVEAFTDAARRNKLRMIHRVDGPIAIYRSAGHGEDLRIYELNAQFASATVYQSGWCFRRLCELGYKAVSPVVIRNAVDPVIFNTSGRCLSSSSRKLKLIATAWSDNPLKGGAFYKWLDEHLDWSRFEFTFVGRTKEKFSRARHIPPQPSRELADILRNHDIYIAASKHESCSNALIEALACGLPALYMNDAGNGELVEFGGLPITGTDDALSQLDRLAENLAYFRPLVRVDTIDEIACRYIELAQVVMEQR